ncbi:hypothetical protein [Winogradskya humida]|uniref:Excisionase family DNA binding protein n=1 Tax=Winogradskya humida TaxID=113566 RepID=A0ABQ4A792_9ACTN|nr:hypothetical protein [Actinoplanes humidus]GIE26732.1 hypothetical protein Ahu01nite_098340 [Actinoplanes humidus]
MPDETWLSLGEVIARFRAAGFPDSESTIRRLIDDGEIESYRSERAGGRRGHRRMKAASVDALFARRSRDNSGDLNEAPNAEGGALA